MGTIILPLSVPAETLFAALFYIVSFVVTAVAVVFFFILCSNVKQILEELKAIRRSLDDTKSKKEG